MRAGNAAGGAVQATGRTVWRTVLEVTTQSLFRVTNRATLPLFSRPFMHMHPGACKPASNYQGLGMVRSI